MQVLRLDGLYSGGIVVEQGCKIGLRVEVDEKLKGEVGVLCLFGQLFFGNYETGDFLMVNDQLLLVLPAGFNYYFVGFLLVKCKHALDVIQHLLFGLPQLLLAQHQLHNPTFTCCL